VRIYNLIGKMGLEGKKKQNKIRTKKKSLLALTVMMMVFLVESRGSVRRTKFVRNTEPEDSV
jgi:hypothetical protein